MFFTDNTSFCDENQAFQTFRFTKKIQINFSRMHNFVSK